MSNMEGQFLLNRYRVLESLGRGGNAEVYKVWDSHRSSFLAMKLLHADLALDRVFIRRFKREAQTLARLQHPHIVRFYDLEQDGRQVFILMDYVEGESLKHKIFDANGPMLLTQVMEIMRPLCQALQYAHKEGFVHSDVKPGNILIDKTGHVMLTDFGISRMTETATVTMIGAGTPAYMSPEQARGENPTPQTDIYALGVILFEMLTGERPFTGENAKTTGSTSEKVRWEQMNLPVPSPRKFNQNISPELEAVALKCLEKEPQKRYSSVLEILNALQNALSVAAKAKPPVPNLDDASTIIKYRAPKAKNKHVIPSYIWLMVGSVIVLAVLMFARGYVVNPALPTLTSTSIPTSTNVPLMSTPLFRGGSTQISPKDGMVMVYVPEGGFMMGSENGANDEKPVHTVYLDAFWIDQTEVTNKQYVACVAVGKCVSPSQTRSFTRDSYYGNSEFDEFPVIYVSWDQSKTYCEWVGRRLPTEAEWEKAASWNDLKQEKYVYPWGNEFSGSIVNFCDTNCPFSNAEKNSNDDSIDTSPIMNYPSGVSPYGAYDMAGNVWEWVNDWYSSFYYQHSSPSNPFGSDSGDVRVLRGGSWSNDNLNVRSTTRNRVNPAITYYSFGFRCSRSP